MALPAGERRVVSVLLADIAESTAIAEQLGPERSKVLFDEVVRPRGNVDEVTIQGQPMSPKTLEEWNANRYDFLLSLGLGRSRPGHLMRGARDTITLSIPIPGTQYIGFPARPPFDDVRVRKALAHGLDRDLLVEGTDEPPALGGFLPPAMPGHSHDLAPRHDPGRAQSLLAEAGYARGRGLGELRLTHIDFGLGEAFRRETEASWEPQWRGLGVRLRQEWVPLADFASATNTDGSFWETAWNTDYPDPHGMLGNFLASNPVGADDERDRLLAKARSLRSRDDRLQLYRDADRLLVAEGTWVVPTIYSKSYLLHRPWVEGIWTSPLGFCSFDEIVVRRPQELPLPADLPQAGQ